MDQKIVEYEVIADFPASILRVGDVIEVFETTGMSYLVEIYGQSEKYDVRDYPHLFRKIDQSKDKTLRNLTVSEARKIHGQH